MTQKELAELTDEELLREQKKMKSGNVINAFLIGIFIGIAVYGAVKKGFGFFTFLPLIFVFIAFNNRNKMKALEKELESRNLK